jgi:thioredoxin-dependent peroxiredoxin
VTLAKGDVAPDFELLDQDGVPRKLSTLLADGPVVLFFYPAAMSTGCTKEACFFRDLGAEYREAGVQRVGISKDAPAKQKEFEQAHGLDYPLLSDPESTVIAAFGAKRKLNLGTLSTKRLTFAIGRDGKVVEVVHAEMDMNQHAAQALEAIQKAGAAS